MLDLIVKRLLLKLFNMKDKLIAEMNKSNVHYGETLLAVRDLFSRKQEATGKEDDKFFSKYWQVYAWAAIIGFKNNKREVGVSLPNTSSFQYQMIFNGSTTIAYGLLLMALGKINASNSEDILDARKILTIISEYAEGGAKYVLELRETNKGLFNNADDYFYEIIDRESQ